MDSIEKQLNSLQGGGQIQQTPAPAVAPTIPSATPSPLAPPEPPEVAAAPLPPGDAPVPPADGATDTPAEPTAETPAAPVDPMEAYMRGDTAKEAVIDDAAKAVLKSVLGIEDVDAYKRARALEVEEVTALKGKADRLAAIEQNLGKLPLELEEAIADYLAGKEADPIARIKNMGVSVHVPSKDVEPTALVDNYYKGKFSADQLQEIKDGTASPELTDVFGKYAELAAGKHDERGAKEAARKQESTQTTAKVREAQERSALQSVANFKNDPISALVDPRVIDDFVSGKLLQDKFFNPDGTYKPDALKRLVTPDVHENLMEKVRKGAFANGFATGESKAHAKQHDGPAMGPGKRVAPAAAPAKDAITEQLNQAQSGKLVGA